MIHYILDILEYIEPNSLGVIIMSRYTTITIRRNLLSTLENIKKELNAKSFNEVILKLIEIYRREKVHKFIKDVEDIRKEGLDDVREEVEKLRRGKWARL